MIDLWVLCEGSTEVRFAEGMIRPHLEAVSARRVGLSAQSLDGWTNYAKTKKEIRMFLATPSPDIRVTTMLDLYGIPAGFPGLQDWDTGQDPYARVAEIERRFRDDIADTRFIPHLQLHEFEALILVGLPRLAERHPSRESEIHRLAAKLASESPELIDCAEPPSKRILQIVPEYRQPADGYATVQKIGLEKLRSRCRHFREWLDRLESL